VVDEMGGGVINPKSLIKLNSLARLCRPR